MIRVAYYLRLSKDDYKKKKSLESNSIENQREILNLYCSKHENYVHTYDDEYIDDGLTGMNFNRPGFQKMYEDAKLHKFDIILVKDLSRFGREQQGTHKYIYELTHKYKIDVYSVSENLSCLNNFSGFETKVRFLFNELYSQNISEKVRSSQRMKMEKGEFIGSFACYGYKKDPDDNNHLIIDEEAARVVKRIFADYLSGMGQQKIARNLNAEGIPCPSAYKELKGLSYHNSNQLPSTKSWTYSTIHKMLSQRMYVGDMVQGKQLKSKFAEASEQIEKSKTEGIIVENKHEAIIKREDFELVGALLKKNTRTLKFDNISLFAGFIHCKECGRALAKTKSGDIITYVCTSYKMYGRDICSRHGVKEKELTEYIINSINAKINEYKKEVADVVNKKNINLEKSEAKKRQNERLKIEAQLSKAERQYRNNMDVFDPEVMDIEIFKSQLKKYKDIMDNAKRKLEEFDNTEPQSKPELFNIPEIKELDRQTLGRFVKDIVVSENKETKEISVNVIWNY